MNINQQQTILTTIDQINELDLDLLIIDAFPGETDFSKTVISEYNAADFLSMLRKMISQLKSEVEKGLGFFLPNRENFNNDWGQIALDTELPGLYSYLANKQFVGAEQLLNKFIYYQIRNGFWDKSKIKTHGIDNEKIKQQFDLINLNNAALNENIELHKIIIEKTNLQYNELADLINKSVEQLSEIKELHITSEDNATEIAGLLDNSTLRRKEINDILNTATEKLEALNEDIKDYQTSYNTIEDSNKKLELLLNQSISNASINLEKYKLDLEYIESRRADIETLTGMAADSSLGTKFHQRQEDLNDGLFFWKCAVPVMTILAIVWVVIVFTCLKADFDNEFVNLGVNLLKTTPAFILMGFAFSQYSKERNLQEEYAFKSAVAMTLTAYSNMLASQDMDDNKSRQEMLLKSIEQVYVQPRIHNEKSESILKYNTKGLRESIQTLSEAVKNLKGGN
jgi:hypothetical protein